jgi:hypothetical protein
MSEGVRRWEGRQLARDSDGHNCQAGKGCAIDAIIKSEEAESVLERMSADQKIGEDTARASITLFSPAGNKVLERLASGAPDGFV